MGRQERHKSANGNPLTKGFILYGGQSESTNHRNIAVQEKYRIHDMGRELDLLCQQIY